MRKLDIILLAVFFLTPLLIVSAQTQSIFDLVNLKNQNLADITAYEKIKIVEAWDSIEKQLPTLNHVAVGIFDTGIDKAHSEFVNVSVTTPTTKDSYEGGHGTQVAGIIGANNVSFDSQYVTPHMNGIISGVRNLDYSLQIHPALSLGTFTLQDNFRHLLVLDEIAKSPGGIQIINGSFGAPICSELPILRRIERRIQGLSCLNTKEFNVSKDILIDLVNQYPQIMFVFGAGNDGINAQFNIPGGSINTLNTLAVGGTIIEDERAGFSGTLGASNFGSTVGISAPAEQVYAPKPGGGYDTNFSGTSASAPLVTGVAAILKSINPDLTPAQIKDILIRTADTITTDKPIGGRLNALGAVCDPLVLNCATSSENFTWTQKFPANNPPKMSHHAMAFDSNRGETVLFGGVIQDPGPSRFVSDQTWVWDGTNWTQRFPIGKPGSRFNHAMTYDPIREQTVIFGGNPVVSSSLTFNDTWVWNGTMWTQRIPATSPPGRSGSAMVYDEARQHVIMFGGASSAGRLNDTWIWDGNNWTQLFPANSPPPVVVHSMAYDGAKSETVVFGGQKDGTPTTSNQTWTWDGTNWTQRLPSTSPPPTDFHSMTYDKKRREVVLFRNPNETWTWDGTNWAQRIPDASPSLRINSFIVYDDIRREIVLFGGTTLAFPQIIFNDTWTWGP